MVLNWPIEQDPGGKTLLQNIKRKETFKDYIWGYMVDMLGE